MEDPRLTKLQELIFEYQWDGSEEVFEQILRRVDDLLLGTAIKLSHRWSFLQTIPLSDLYQTAVESLYDAVRTVRKQDSKKFIPARIVLYIKANVKKRYGYLGREVREVPEDEDIFLQADRNPTAAERRERDEMDRRDTGVSLLQLIDNMTRRGDLSKMDVTILRERMVKGKRASDVAKDLGISIKNVFAMTDDLLALIRQRIRESEQVGGYRF